MALVLLAPGAGAPSSSPFLRRWAGHLAALGPVESFDYPYMIAGRRRPDPLPALLEAHRAALRAARARHPAGPVVLAGKSMGSRVGCHLASALDPGERPAALVCLGFPLRSPSGALRDEVLLALRTPVIFVQGTRDPLCPLDLLEGARARMQARTALHVVEGGDHGLAPTKAALRAAGEDLAAVEARALAAIRSFVEACVG